MKTLQKILVLSALLVGAKNVAAQTKPDLGIQFNTAEQNRLQLQFRAPLKEKSMLRFTLSQGQWSGYHFNRIIDATDSLVTFRENTAQGQYFDCRFGVERKIDFLKSFSIHADVVFVYQKSEYHNWDSYSFKDSLNNWSQTNYYPHIPAIAGNSATATEHFLGAGLVAGYSFNFPLADQFFLSCTMNFTTMSRSKISHHENADVQNEFYNGKNTALDFHTSAGIGLRYIFGKKTKKATQS
jgi:hypothetical protein